jgi:hypothetical protein
MYWHLHHDKLMEWCWDYDERKDFIKTWKSENEKETRLRLLQPVKGKLPEDVLKAGAAYGKARAAFTKASVALDKAWSTYRKAAWVAYDKERAAYDKAWAAYKKAIEKNMDRIIALHARECPNCVWNGEEMVFPSKE